MPEEKVIAPIMGTIISIKIKVGDKVKKGDVLLILEAMKMENEIFSSRNGTIKSILVSEGKTVNYGEPLLVIEY